MIRPKSIPEVSSQIRAIYGFIIAIIGVYIGVALIPGINDTIATITTPTYDTGVASIIQVILIVVAAAIVLMLLRSTEFS